jgi:hypothetical protein
LQDHPDLSALVDGRVGGRDILHLADWFQQLAAGKACETRLTALEEERLLLAIRWSMVRRMFQWGLGVLVLAGIGAFVRFMLYRKKQVETRLRHQICCDLHDEVGSNLGGIALAARRMEDSGASASDFAELSLMTREASASLKDVVWVIDQTTLRLPELLKRLAVRAERVLRGVKLESVLPADCPNSRFSLVNYDELYDLKADPGQTKNVIDQYPEVVAEFRAAYDLWWDDVQSDFVNEEVIGPEMNPMKVSYWSQFGGEPTAAMLKQMNPLNRSYKSPVDKALEA